MPLTLIICYPILFPLHFSHFIVRGSDDYSSPFPLFSDGPARELAITVLFFFYLISQNFFLPRVIRLMLLFSRVNVAEIDAWFWVARIARHPVFRALPAMELAGFTFLQIAIETSDRPFLRLSALSIKDITTACLLIIVILTYLWFTSYVFVRTQKVIFGRWVPPDALLISALANAYAAVVFAKQSDWRTFSYRKRFIAEPIRAAANVFEGSMLRMLVGSGDTGAGVTVRTQLKAAAAELRQKLAWLTTPKSDTREHLAKFLGEALLIAATGDLDRLPKAIMITSDQPPRNFWVHFGSVLRLLAIVLGPTLIVLSLWHQIEDPDIRRLAAQFAAVCFITGIFSALDPKGGEKLSSVVAAGNTIFGWGKAK